jgi:two-component system KDP operon response regulator KdpE
MIWRTHAAALKIASPTSDFFAAGGIKFDCKTRQVRVGDKTTRLTPKESRLFRYLISRQGRIVPHQELLAAVWGAKFVGRLNSLHVFISNLRKKIEPDPARPRYVLNEPWVGYVFSIPDQPEEAVDD